MNYNLKIVDEFKIGELTIPFLFDISKIKENYDALIVKSSINSDYEHEKNINLFKIKMFEYLYLDKFILDIDENIQELLMDFKEDVDYEVTNKTFKIKTKDLFFEILMCLDIDEDKVIFDLKNFITTNESKLIEIFTKDMFEELDYEDDEDTRGNNFTHKLQWALGETSTNNTPYFQENMNKATIDWSVREVLLRNFYKSKIYKMEHARNVEAERKIELAKNENQGR